MRHCKTFDIGGLLILIIGSIIMIPILFVYGLVYGYTKKRF